MNWADREYAIGRGIAAIGHKQEAALQPFVRAVVEYGLPNLLAQATGSTFPNVSSNQLASIPYPDLEIEEQRAIAAVLGALDEKIDQNRRTAQVLERLAGAIFRAWYVDFEPVKAKIAGATTFPSMPQTVFDSLPTRFVESDMGPVPEGWEVKPLSQLTYRITKGTTPTKGETGPNPKPDVGINYLRVNAITDDGLILYDKLQRIPETVHHGVLKRSILQKDDVLYTIAGTIGRIAIVDEDLLPANTNQAVAIIRPNPALLPANFLFLAIGQQSFQEELHSNIVQAVQANLSLGMISKAKLVVPPKIFIESYDPLGDLVQNVMKIRRESRKLAEIRGYLLPKLLSGQIRVEVANG